jgi:hypothetical protein
MGRESRSLLQSEHTICGGELPAMSLSLPEALQNAGKL